MARYPGLNLQLRPLDALKKDAFRTEDIGRVKDFALASLRFGLRAWASTPHAIRGAFDHVIAPDGDGDPFWDENTSQRYRAEAFEAVIHLQHFAELVVKQALRARHESLVAIDGGDHHLEIDDLLHNKSPGMVLGTIDAAKALARLRALIKAKRIGAPYEFIVEHEPALKALNELRNRIWHRGTLVLRYRALDELVGKHVLPFVFAATAIEPYANRAVVWRPAKLAANIDPLDALQKCFQGPFWNVAKVAFLKELLRAAYCDEVAQAPHFRSEELAHRKQAVHRATLDLEIDELIDGIHECPVCGGQTLVVYREHTRAKCDVCSLELYPSFGNPAHFGIELGPYWAQDEDGVTADV